MNAAGAGYVDSDSGRLGDPLPVVRREVRALLESAPGFSQLEPRRRRELAHAMVRVCHVAASLLKEEVESGEAAAAATSPPAPGNARPAAQAQAVTSPSTSPSAATSREAGGAPLARAQEFGAAADRIAGTTRAVLNAVSFPRFVAELINGVFKAVIDSTTQQMDSFVDLLNNVAATTSDFADANVSADSARQWLVERFPASYEIAQEEDEPLFDEPAAESAVVRLRPGASAPPAGALKAALGLGPSDPAPSGDPERALLPLVRATLARTRHQMLASMVAMGLQRIVIESGRIDASMRFHIDTRSALAEDRGSRFDARHQSSAAARFGVGPWGISASMTNTIGYVSTQRTQSTEELNTDLDLNSSVSLFFKTDYLPLDQLAGSERVAMIKANQLNPSATTPASSAGRAAAQHTGEAARRKDLTRLLAPTATQPPAAGQPGSVEDATQARDDAAANAAAPGGQTSETPASPATPNSPSAAAPADAAPAAPTPARAPDPAPPAAPAPARTPDAVAAATPGARP